MRLPAAVAATSCAVGLFGCSADSASDFAPAPTTTSVAAAPSEWVAVYAVSPYSDAMRQEFIQAAGENVFEGQARCFDGLVDRLGIAGDAQILALDGRSQFGARLAAA